MEILLIGIGMFLAGFVDSIAGGGGLISTPTLLLVGLPPHIALGTNKLAASSGTLVSSHEFFKSNKLNLELLKMLVPFAFLGAVLGVITLQFISPDLLRLLIPFMIFGVAIYTTISKKVGMIDSFHGFTKKNKFLGKLLTTVLGFYDGFFGPGTGTFFMFGLVKIFKFDFTIATANTKVLNFTTGFAALLTFLYNGQVNFEYGLISIFFMILGSKLGSKMAIKNGSKFIKPIFIVMSLVMAGKMIFI
jgi:uncharacterized membrane protein YfcA